jgi:hypothetical protein
VQDGAKGKEMSRDRDQKRKRCKHRKLQRENHQDEARRSGEKNN